jgi:hypothetical protein
MPTRHRPPVPEEQLVSWLRGRLPSIPEPFLPFLLEGDEEVSGEGAEPTAMALAGRGMEDLAAAIARPGRDREAAFRLLSADAFLTYACEAATEEEDVRAGLERILESSVDRLG